MYRVKLQSLAASQRSRNNSLLVASTAAIAAAGSLATKTSYCQHDPSVQAEAEHLKEHVQGFADHVLEMADSPPSSSSSPRSGKNHGRGESTFFSSNDYRADQPHPQFSGRMERFRGAYVEEPLVPALIYVTIAGMTGSFIARKTLGAAAYCIPKTTNNVINGLRTYDYSQMSREWQHKYLHAKQSVVDTTHGLTAAADSVIHGAKDAAHEVSDKTAELTDKTSKTLNSAKEKSVELAHDLRDKTEEVAEDVKSRSKNVAKDIKSKSKDIASQLGDAKDKVQDQVEDKAHQAKDWWQSEKKAAEKSAKDMKRTMREQGRNTREWFDEKTHELNNNTDKGEMEHGFDRLKDKARQGWENARDEAQDAWNRGTSHGQYNGERWKDQTRDWVRDRSRDMHDRFEDMKDRSDDWAQDHRHDWRKMGRDAEDRFDQARHDLKRRGREFRESSEDYLHDAKRDVYNKGEDMWDRGRHQLHRAKRDVDDARSRWGPDDDRVPGRSSAAARWGPFEDHGGHRDHHDEKEEYAGRGYRYQPRYDQFDTQRPSVTEAAKEGKHWWQPKSPADPYEYYDDNRQSTFSHPSRSSSSSASSWREAGSNSSDQAKEQLNQAKQYAEHGMGHLKDAVGEKAQYSRSWLSDKADELKDRFEQGKDRFENELNGKFAHEPTKGYNYYHDRQGRDFGGQYRHHNHASIYSNDNWFHYDHGENNRASAGRYRERGM
ncbi:hypothetical protein BX616_003988 [Lobosporangium transversale]|nr:hypothetical protein BX616_003988 [Lobosporangium transversale]